ncbi:MAG TPA: ABC transporter ATP-binding protein [Anaerolineaceae bacterium]|jgi:branched-chain amino acid transport system ATP-binding protein|nr:ABC transporter ATP-binding protein [Anaerolineaceae bacterium]
MSNEIILEAVNLSKVFGGLVAVDNVSIQIKKQTLHAIIGPNGAGKTTLFNMLSGVMPPTSGRVLYKDQDITHLSPQKRAHLGIGRSYQITNIFENLTVLENIRLGAQAMGKDNFKLFHRVDHYTGYIEKAEEVIATVGLSGREMVLARNLPHGEKRKLELGIMLACDPELLLFDEPTAGMSSEQVPELIKIINQVVQENDRTAILVEHRMDMVMSISDVITVMNQGRVLAEGSPHEIATNPLVQTAYLGDLYGELA